MSEEAINVQIENISTTLNKMADKFDNHLRDTRDFQKEMLEKIYNQGNVIETHSIIIKEDQKKIHKIQSDIENAQDENNKTQQELTKYTSHMTGFMEGVNRTLTWIKFLIGSSLLAAVGYLAKAFL